MGGSTPPKIATHASPFFARFLLKGAKLHQRLERSWQQHRCTVYRLSHHPRTFSLVRLFALHVDPSVIGCNVARCTTAVMHAPACRTVVFAGSLACMLAWYLMRLVLSRASSACCRRVLLASCPTSERCRQGSLPPLARPSCYRQPRPPIDWRCATHQPSSAPSHR